MIRVLAVLCVVLLGAGACSDLAAAPDDGSGALEAVASVYPLAWIAEQVAPDAEVTYLAARGQDAHDLELSPSERALLERADVALYLGDLGFQPQVEDILRGRDGPVVAAVEAVDPGALLPVDPQSHDRDQAIDPHLWFDPGLMAAVAARTGEAFAAADPAGAQNYVAGATRVAAELRALDAEVAALLSGCRHERVVVSHEAYAYLLVPHGLQQVGVSPPGAHGEASPRDITELAAAVRDAGIDTVLSEPVEGRAGAAAVAREAGVGLADIYSLDIVSLQDAAAGYPELLRRQAAAVARAAECAGG